MKKSDRNKYCNCRLYTAFFFLLPCSAPHIIMLFDLFTLFAPGHAVYMLVLLNLN